MAFAAVTILMDTLHQHFLQPTPRFPLRNKTKVKLLYKHLSSLQTSLEQDFKVGECDEALKALEAQMRDVSIELRFQIEHQLRLFYLGKSMKLRLHSAKKLLPIFTRAKEDIETIYRDLNEDDIETMDLESFVLRMVESLDFNEHRTTAYFGVEFARKYVTLPVSKKLRLRWAQEFFHTLNGVVKGGDLKYVMEMLWKHFTLPVSGMPPHINKRIKSFCAHYVLLFRYTEESEDEEETEDEWENKEEQKSDDEQGIEDEQESGDEKESEDEEETEDEWENKEKQKSDDEQGIEDEQESGDEKESEDEKETEDEWEKKEEQKSDDEQRSKDEHEESDDEQGSQNEQQEEEEESDDECETEVIQPILSEAESIIKKELRAPSYLNKYMKQRIQARHKIHQIFMQGIKLTSYINKEVLKVKNAYYNQSNTPQGNNTNSASLRGPEGENITVGDSLQHTTVEMVGYDDEFNMIMDKLNQQSKQREIVSIVGMGGIGKTTLAKRIYGDASFISRFDCRAWVTISQVYNPTKVFKALLRSLAPGVHEENNEAGNNELAEVVYKCLKRQRYFIIIDDIWSADVWCDLQKCFPDDNNGSRMLLTTRLKNVADYAGSGGNLCHTMRFLNSYESWNLFHNQVVHKRITLSPEFERIGREVVKKCKGLPLAINVVAGLLSSPKQDLNEWELIAKNVHTLSIDHSNQQGENIIDLSYTFLPHHLKHCFLSIGCFPEDSELPESFIVDFWVSEGFLKVLRSKSLEDVARESLQDLVDRNLLLVSTKMNENGSLKEYQMHDMLRELALREAQRENLLCLKSDSSIFSVGFRRTQLINSSRISHPWSIQSKFCRYNSLSHTFSTFLVSLDVSTHGYIKQFHFHFKFLRGLLLEDQDYKAADAFADSELMGLVHLRFLKSYSAFKLNTLPLFMLWNLQRLEFFFDDYSQNEPLNICGLPQLKKIIAHRGNIRLVPPRSVHHNLESIAFLDYRSCTQELFMRIPNLRILGVDEADFKINLKRKVWFGSLACLYKLEYLKVRGNFFNPKCTTIHSMGTLSIENVLPNLKRLKLFGTYLNWESLYIVGMLPKLEVLILASDATFGKKWKPKDGGFHGLKVLSIYDCDLQSWKATSGHFPVLECLVLMHMSCLKKIPSDFADIATLKSIKLYNCLKSAISSAKCIQEEQREYGNNDFSVDILRNDEFDDNYNY